MVSYEMTNHHKTILSQKLLIKYVISLFKTKNVFIHVQMYMKMNKDHSDKS